MEVYTHRCVYEPSDDSILAVKLLSHMAKRGFRFDKIVDIGTGTGILALAAARLFNPRILAAVDINPYAVMTANMSLRGLALIVRCDSTSCLNRNIIWDLAIINPPYLPVDDSLSDPECRGFVELSWSSGKNLLDRLCREAASIAKGTVMVYSSLSNIDTVTCLEEQNFKVKYSVKQSFFMEEITALYAMRDG